MPRVEPAPLRIDARVVLGLLRSSWYFLLIGLLLGATAAYVWTAQQTKLYAADAVGLVTSGPTASAGEASVADSVATSRAEAFEVLGSSRAVGARAATALGLDVPAQSLVAQVTVQREPGSALIRITARGTDPVMISKLANAWVDALAAEIKRVETINAPQRTANGFLYMVPVDEASPPATPYSPVPRRNLEIGLLAGLLLAVGAALVRYRLDRRIHGTDDLEPFGHGVSAVIPLDDAFEGRRALPVGGDEPTGHAGAAGEAIRKLRTNLQFMDVDDPPRTIVVTSALPGEGKSTVAANLALALAAAQTPVVLVDADLRRPTQADAFGLVEGSGLTDVLVGRATFAAVAQSPTTYPTLHVLAAGSLPPNPSELLGSKRMGALLDDLGKRYVVIIDAPPLLPVTDASVLTAKADGALVVVSARRTLDSQVAEALGELEAVNGRVLGLVLNKVRRGARSGYYAYAYGASGGSRRRWLPARR